VIKVHLISSPLALASEEYAPKAWTQFDRIPALKGVRFVRGSVKSVDPEAKQAVISEADTQAEVVQDYDFLVAATGLRRVWPVVPQAQTRESYLEEVRAHIDAIKASDGVVVVGGGQFYIPLFNSSLTKTGAVGIEMAAEIKLVMPEQKVTLIHSRDKLCSAEPLPDDFKDRCLIALHEAGVETVMGQRVVESTTGRMGDKVVSTLKLADGTTLQAGQVIYAVSKSVPSTSYLPASVLDEEGYVKITSRSVCRRVQSRRINKSPVSLSGLITSPSATLSSGPASNGAAPPCTTASTRRRTSTGRCCGGSSGPRRSPWSWPRCRP
jgi:thioredoxin reductase